MEHPPTLYSVFGSLLPLSVPIQALILSTLMTLMVAALAGRAIAAAGRGDEGLVPTARFGLRNVIEVLFEGMAGLMRDTIGPTWPRFVPLVGTLALFILVSNLLGLVPFFGGATSYVETNVTWALISFTVAEVCAFRAQGAGRYVQHLSGPVWWLSWLLLPIEAISHLSRILSLTVRLTGNMFADHTLIAVFLSMGIVNLFVPWVFMGLGLFVAFLQAFIFAFLTIIYIGQAIEEDHH